MKYEMEGLEGMGIFSPMHFAFIGLKNNRENLNGKTLTIEDKAKAFDDIRSIEILSPALEKENRAKSTPIHSDKPSNIGKSFSWDFELKDGYFTFWIILPDGSNGFSGKARKIAKWNDKTELSKMNGLWKYSQGLEGHLLWCGNYAITFVGNNVNVNTGTEAGKVQAFESFHSSCLIVQKLNGRLGNGITHTLIASDIRMEKQSSILIHNGSTMIYIGFGWWMERVNKWEKSDRYNELAK
ncbi:MAG: hypothetical protein ABIR66_07230 [Saprospiraceae bacterium]